MSSKSSWERTWKKDTYVQKKSNNLGRTKNVKINEMCDEKDMITTIIRKKTRWIRNYLQLISSSENVSSSNCKLSADFFLLNRTWVYAHTCRFADCAGIKQLPSSRSSAVTPIKTQSDESPIFSPQTQLRAFGRRSSGDTSCCPTGTDNSRDRSKERNFARSLSFWLRWLSSFAKPFFAAVVWE